MKLQEQLSGMRLQGLFAVAMLATFALSGCGAPDQTITAPSAERIRLGENQNYYDFGSHVVHVNALTTNQLTSEVATAYKIRRSDKSAMLNVVLLEKSDAAANTPAEGDVTVSASNLSGQLKSVEMREVRDGENIYYIGEARIANQETLIFEIDVKPAGANAPLLLTYSRKFYID